MSRMVIVGAGVGGLTTAAILARAGLDVTVLEAQVYPGGCASTFYHKGYRFEAGATLAGGFYPGGPMDRVARAAGIDSWPARQTDPSMLVHLPDGTSITRWADERRWQARREAFGPEGESFWRWQERTADALWNLALRLPPWPPQTAGDFVALAGKGLAWLGADQRQVSAGLLADAFRPVAAHLKGASTRLRQFVDGQLLIAAQTTSTHANALYGASALDLPRRGVVHLAGGIGCIADVLAEAVRAKGGAVHYRQEVTRVVREAGRPVAVETRRGDTFPADMVIVNLPPWNIARLLADDLPARLRRLPEKPRDGWGAFMVYLGLDSSAVPEELPLHHQVVMREPMGEGHTVFLSISPAWDLDRAPEGHRAITLSTHTRLNDWWQLLDEDREAYDRQKAGYQDRLLDAAARVIPEVREVAALIMAGSPVTFERFTRRAWGWVGGFPQTSLFRAWGPRLAPGLWMVGDSIFPGQSTAAVALGGWRVAGMILAQLRVSVPVDVYPRQVVST